MEGKPGGFLQGQDHGGAATGDQESHGQLCVWVDLQTAQPERGNKMRLLVLPEFM